MMGSPFLGRVCGVAVAWFGGERAGGTGAANCYMKTNRASGAGQHGNVLLMSIVVTGLIGFVLVVYLTLVRSQQTSNVRSQVWNSAIPIVEAGVEEALAHLNKHGATNLACDGWSVVGAEYRMTRAVGDGYYSVRIRNYTATNSSPIIESYGYVVAPPVLASGQSSYFVASATGGAEQVGPTFIGRGVQVNTRRDFIFAKGMVAKDSIDLNGNNVRADSFDSMDPNYSNNGFYDPARIRDNGDIAVNSSLTNSLITGNADIYGHVSTGPGGTIAIGPNGAVGSTNWHNAGNHGIQGGWSADDMNVSFPDIEPPFDGGAFTPSGGWITNTTVSYATNSSTISSLTYPAVGGVAVTTNFQTASAYPVGSSGPVTTNYAGGRIKNYTYPVFSYSSTLVSTNTTTTITHYDVLITEPGNYQLANLSGSVYVSANAVLYVTTTLNISSLLIAMPNGRLALYSSAPSVALAGNTGANSAGMADRFSFWGLPSVTSISFSGNASFTGTIYAPNADFQLNGGGNNTIDFIGASITRTARMNGHFNFHYDEALRRIGPFRGYIINSWMELPPTSVPAFSVVTY